MTIAFPTRMSFGLLLLRMIPGLIFLSEGLQKMLFPDTLGVGRFAQLGFEHPAFWAGLTGGVEIGCGCLLIIGLLARWATLPLLIVMGVAFAKTKWPELITKGFWAMAHDYRTDFAMTLALVAILSTGPGDWSVDNKMRK